MKLSNGGGRSFSLGHSLRRLLAKNDSLDHFCGFAATLTVQDDNVI